jgi:hypothetical protein
VQPHPEVDRWVALTGTDIRKHCGEERHPVFALAERKNQVPSGRTKEDEVPLRKITF